MAKKKKKKKLPVTRDICGREFTHASGMQYHKLTEHLHEKPFSCQECGAKFMASSTLNNHLWLHTGDWPFTCKLCLMTFMQASVLAYHTKKKHAEGGKFHECELCKELFPTLALLQVHMMCRHSGSQPFHCFYCSMAFCSPGALQSHVTSQHFTQTDSTFTCELCGELFPSQGKLEGHLSTEHSKVAFSQATTAQIVQVTQTWDQGAAEHIISFDDAKFVTLPKSQVSQTGSELVAVTVEDLFDDSHSDL